MPPTPFFETKLGSRFWDSRIGFRVQIPGFPDRNRDLDAWIPGPEPRSGCLDSRTGSWIPDPDAGIPRLDPATHNKRLDDSQKMLPF